MRYPSCIIQRVSANAKSCFGSFLCSGLGTGAIHEGQTVITQAPSRFVVHVRAAYFFVEAVDRDGAAVEKSNPARKALRGVSSKRPRAELTGACLKIRCHALGIESQFLQHLYGNSNYWSFCYAGFVARNSRRRVCPSWAKLPVRLLQHPTCWA